MQSSSSVVVNDSDTSDGELRNRLVPSVSQAPGFVAGYWTRSGSAGLSMIVFESEDAARRLAARIPRAIPESVTLESVEVREVIASA